MKIFIDLFLVFLILNLNIIDILKNFIMNLFKIKNFINKSIFI
jgi:hypothetical protein